MEKQLRQLHFSFYTTKQKDKQNPKNNINLLRHFHLKLIYDKHIHSYDLFSKIFQDNHSNLTVQKVCNITLKFYHILLEV